MNLEIRFFDERPRPGSGRTLPLCRTHITGAVDRAARAKARLTRSTGGRPRAADAALQRQPRKGQMRSDVRAMEHGRLIRIFLSKFTWPA